MTLNQPVRLWETDDGLLSCNLVRDLSTPTLEITVVRGFNVLKRQTFHDDRAAAEFAIKEMRAAGAPVRRSTP
jgi:hypothetical protein